MFATTFIARVLLMTVCQSAVPTSSTQVQEPITKEMLRGQWYFNEWTIAKSLYFEGDLLIMDNHIDTLFTFRYDLLGSELLLHNTAGAGEYSNTIFSISKDTLIMQNILSIQKKRIYTREKRPYKLSTE